MRKLLLSATAVVAVMAGTGGWWLLAKEPNNPYVSSQVQQLGVAVEEYATHLSHPWGMEFLPDGAMLVTERGGRLWRVVSKDLPPVEIKGVPKVRTGGQAGLLDVTIDPAFAENQRIYFSYAEAGEGDTAGTAVASAALKGNALQDVRVIFRQQPKVEGGNHWGSRLVFGRDGMLYVTLGERFDYRDKAQDLGTHMGKIVRITPNGRVPSDNPFAMREGALPEIFSYGHRNPQAAALHPQTGELWAIEHGARGGDEINIIRAGNNYGWPVISYGRNYDMTSIGEGTAKEGMEQPIYYWDPSIAPSGMAFYGGAMFPDWQGDLFVGALAGTALVRLELNGDEVVTEERLLEDRGNRIRDVAEGPDGALYLLVDSDEGAVLRLTPATQ
jgi:aldose sugar dehydrogenase